MANEYKVAVATSDGAVINRHFGRAETFYIYRISRDGEEPLLLEKRSVDPVCQGGEHDDGKLQENVEKLKDCQYVLVWRIGDGARYILEQNGLEVYEIPGLISESLSKLESYLRVQEFFKF